MSLVWNENTQSDFTQAGLRMFSHTVRETVGGGREGILLHTAALTSVSSCAGPQGLTPIFVWASRCESTYWRGETETGKTGMDGMDLRQLRPNRGPPASNL